MPVDAGSVLHGIVIAFGGLSAVAVVVVVMYWLVAEVTRIRPERRVSGARHDEARIAAGSEPDSHHEG